MRQLAAIMFVDMAGYTAMMQENEQLAKAKRLKLKAVLEKSVSQSGGKILQYYGDGSLSIFNSAIDAVSSAIDVQRELREEPRVDLRIGIHSGDVIIEEETIYGDGVNLASRIESLAVPGSIFISEKIYDEIKNQDSIESRELGYFELKNVKQPVRIFAVSNEGLVVPPRNELRGKTKTPGNRLAVLPFVNMSTDPENEYFSDGITEELLNALTRIDGLQVTSRTSSFAFKGKQGDVRDIALKLNVDKVLEGSVRKSGNRVRITAQLINAADGYHIWSENYDRNLTDIFEVQDEISKIIANKLRENLLKSDKADGLKSPSLDIDAYTLYLKGLHFWNKLTPPDTRKSIEYFERAIAKEPDYAQAYAMIAAAYGFLAATGQTRPGPAYEIVHNYADKAIRLDPKVPEGYISKGAAYFFYEWDFEKAYECFKKAIDLNPAAVGVYNLLSFYYIVKGKKEEAIKIMEKAVEIDPLSAMTNLYLGETYLFGERYEDAERQADKMLDINPEMRRALDLKGWAVGFLGDWQKALEIFKEEQRLVNHPLKGLAPMAVAYTKLGEREKALECIKKIEQREREEPDAVLDGDLIMVWHAFGDIDKTLYYMERSIKNRIGPISLYIQYPDMVLLRKDPRFLELMKKYGIEVI